MCYEYSVKWLRTFHKMPTKHSVRRRGPIHRTRILALPKTCISITKYVFPHYQICVSVPHFVGVYVYAGTINLPLQLLTDCHFAANRLR